MEKGKLGLVRPNYLIGGVNTNVIYIMSATDMISHEAAKLKHKKKS